MRRTSKSFALLLISYSLLLVAIPVLAATAPDYGLQETASSAGLSTDGNLPALVGKIIKTGLGLLGILFFLLTVYGGLIWMKARGNDKEVERAKEIITSAVIGLAIIAAAYAITVSVIGALS